MPGEVVQCAGCHEPQNTAPLAKPTIALNADPAEIEPWHGPMRGFSYAREVQPVVTKHCVGCHDGSKRDDGRTIPNLRGDVKITDWAPDNPPAGVALGAASFRWAITNCRDTFAGRGSKATTICWNRWSFTRAPHSWCKCSIRDTTAWISTPKPGTAWSPGSTSTAPITVTWGEDIADPGVQRQRRRELLKLYGGYDDDPEAVPQTSADPVVPLVPKPAEAKSPQLVECPDWPFDAAEAKRRQEAAGPATTQSFKLADGVELEMVLVPAGEFVMGSTSGQTNEQPMARVAIDRPFWMGRLEITNRQYALFDPEHDSRVETKNTYQFGVHGYPANKPQQPVVRVTWEGATAFCRWLSATTGEEFSLPTEAQWEYACRAGTSTPMSYGELDADFSSFANISDASMTLFASDPYTIDTPLKNPAKYDDWIPKDARFNDGSLLSVAPGSYQTNAWGLNDMHGNVAEWTRSTYRPYPNADEQVTPGRKVARGGSWRDLPKRCTSSFRTGFEPYQRVYNVGFRVICEARPSTVAAAR